MLRIAQLQRDSMALQESQDTLQPPSNPGQFIRDREAEGSNPSPPTSEIRVVCEAN
jgi:hypothetical protein